MDKAAEQRDLETREVWDRRYRAARAAGLIPEEALDFASGDTDIAELRKLVAAGCPVDQLRRIII